jgi:3-deoxy-7-phosphoheptulonate synthase
VQEPSCHPVRVGAIRVGGPGLVVMAGPCAVESAEQILGVARAVKAAGAHMLRGGAYKPRTSPDSFQGLGRPGLELLVLARHETGLPVVTEVMDPRDVALVAQYANVLQIGARNMYNYPLLREVGQAGLPVLLKRGMSATMEEWLLAAEYIRAGGTDTILLCERGVRGTPSMARNVLDLGTMVLAKRQSGYPVVADPSHAAGRRDLVIPLACAAVAAGADALLVEVHPDPDRALSDGQQSLSPEQFVALMGRVRQLCRLAEPVVEGGE